MSAAPSSKLVYWLVLIIIVDNFHHVHSRSLQVKRQSSKGITCVSFNITKCNQKIKSLPANTSTADIPECQLKDITCNRFCESIADYDGEGKPTKLLYARCGDQNLRASGRPDRCESSYLLGSLGNKVVCTCNTDDCNRDVFYIKKQKTTTSLPTTSSTTEKPVLDIGDSLVPRVENLEIVILSTCGIVLGVCLLFSICFCVSHGHSIAKFVKGQTLRVINIRRSRQVKQCQCTTGEPTAGDSQTVAAA